MTVADQTRIGGGGNAVSAGRWLAFVPRDTVVVRDGRSFDAGAAEASSHRAQSVAPWPSTLAGATATALNLDDIPSTVEPAAVRGPVLGRRDPAGRGGEWATYFPIPADVQATALGRPQDRAVSRLVVSSWAERVVAHDLVNGPERLLVPRAGAEHHEPLTGLIAGQTLSRYLAGSPLPVTVEGLHVLEESPLRPELRVGLARDGRVVKDGFLYAMTHLRPQDGWALLAECADSVTSAGLTPQGPVPLGGRARLADVETASGVQWPQPPERFPEGRVLVYVATPGVWPQGWRPPLPPGARLVAAATPGPVPVPTASPRVARERGRRLLDTVTLRWAVPAGAVYLLAFDGDRPEDTAADWARRVHGRALGPSLDPRPGSQDGPVGEPGTDRTSTAGFGVVLTGVWPEQGPHEGGRG
jgi:CRISPR type III-B/RAMP module-associated protein Cmr3